MSWFQTARRGAANEFGRRMWRWFAVFEAVRWFARRVLPTLVILAALGMAVWTAVRWSLWWVPRLLVLSAVSAALGLALWVWRRWRWTIRASHYRPVVVAVVTLVAITGGAVYWLH